MEMIVVIATMHARKGSETEMLDVLRRLVPETRKEKGCIQYDLHISTEDAASFAFYERWIDRAALDAHLRSAHFAAASPDISRLSERPPFIGIYKRAD
jgi:quinol monooxygenase YgiN